MHLEMMSRHVLNPDAIMSRHQVVIIVICINHQATDPRMERRQAQHIIRTPRVVTALEIQVTALESIRLKLIIAQAIVPKCMTMIMRMIMQMTMQRIMRLTNLVMQIARRRMTMVMMKRTMTGKMRWMINEWSN